MIGKTIIELPRVASTNSYAGEHLLDTDFEDGTVVWTHEQFAGRGQHHNVWESESGKNLTFTVCLRPDFLSPDQQFLLNKAIALGLLDFIRASTMSLPVDMVSSLTIKWPNDLYIGEQKAGGILIENRVMGARLEASLAGIGVNINQTRFAPDIPNPVSLIHLLRHETVLKDALMTACHALNGRYEQLKDESEREALVLEFDKNLLGFEQWRDFTSEGRVFRGMIRGADEYGRLVVADEQGVVHQFVHREIEMNLTGYSASRT